MTGEAGGTMPSRRLELVPPDELKGALADGIRAQHEAGDLQASRDSFERAYRLAERAGDAESMALAALGLAGLWVAERRTVTSTVLLEARLQHVLALLDPRSALALRVRTGWRGRRTTPAARTPPCWPHWTRCAPPGIPNSSPRPSASPTTACSAPSTSARAASWPSS